MEVIHLHRISDRGGSARAVDRSCCEEEVANRSMKERDTEWRGRNVKKARTSESTLYAVPPPPRDAS